MKAIALLGIAAGLAAGAGCASPGTAEDFKWTVEAPKIADKGAEFAFVVRTVNAEGGEVGGVPFHYQIHWTGGSSAPLRHGGETGEARKIRARMVPGPATILVTSLNREGLDVKVAEAVVEVK